MDSTLFFNPTSLLILLEISVFGEVRTFSHVGGTYVNAINWLHENKLIFVNDGVGYGLTARGLFFVNFLKTLPLPVERVSFSVPNFQHPTE